MFYYLFAFALTLLCTGTAERMYARRRKWLGHGFAAAAIFTLCWFAGARGDSVGTDTMVYIIPQFALAQRLTTFSAYFAECALEPLYAMLIYLSAKLTDTPFLLLFISQFFIALPVMLVAYRKRDEMSMTFVMFIYCFLFFNMSLNIMRQLAACALMLLAYDLFSNEKRLTSLLCLVIAVLFHSSAALVGLMYLAIHFVTRGEFAQWMRLWITLAVTAVLFFAHPLAALLINTLHVLPQEYYERILATMNAEGLSIAETVFRSLFALAPLLLYCRTGTTQQQDRNFLAFLSVILSFAALVSEYLIRFSYYPQFFFVLTLPSVPRRFAHRKHGQLIGYATIGALALAYWFLIYVSWSWHGTMPYVLR